MTLNRLLERRWILVPLLIFASTRVVAGIMLSIGAERQMALTETTVSYRVSTPTPESPGYLGVVTNWDGQWYRSIAENGYPSSLPRVEGEVQPNEWAFSAGYPLLVRLFMAVFRIDFPLAATVASMACAAIAVVLLYALVRDRMDDFAAVTVILALCTFPSSPVLQVAYTESMALLLVVLALGALSRQNYGWFVVWAVILSVTRPVLLPLAAVCGMAWLVRWRNRHTVAFPRRERWIAAAAGISCAALTGVWPAFAAMCTRDTTAFTATMAAWPTNKSLGGPLVNWLTVAVANPAVIGAFVAPILVITAYAAIRQPASALPPAWRWWGLIYMLYILAATKPNAGILRYLLLAVFPLVPLLETRTASGSRLDSVMQWVVPLALASAGLVGQYYWVTRVFTIDESPSLQPFP